MRWLKFCDLALTGCLAAGLVACGGGGSASAPAPTPVNRAPVANAGGALSTSVGTAVPLDGSASTDADGDTITYDWQISARPAGSVASIAAPTAVRPSFNPDVAGAYTVRLVVSDGRASSAAAETTITAISASLPPAAAGLYLQISPLAFSTVDASGHLADQAATCRKFDAADTDPQGVVLAVSATEMTVTEVNPASGQCRVRFNLPVPMKAIAVAADGTVVTVATTRQFGQDVMWVFSAAGVARLQIGITASSGSSAIGTIRTVDGIDFGPDGGLYVTDHGTLYANVIGGPVVANKTRVWKINIETGGGFLQYWYPTFEATGDIDLSPDGVLRAVSGTSLQAYKVSDWTPEQPNLTLDRNVGAGGALFKR